MTEQQQSELAWAGVAINPHATADKIIASGREKATDEEFERHVDGCLHAIRRTVSDSAADKVMAAINVRLARAAGAI